MRYLIAIPVEGPEVSDFIKLRDEYSHLAPRWKITLGPHITIFRPSEFRLGKEDAIDEFKTAPGIKSFNQQFNGFQSFMNYSNNAIYSEPINYDYFVRIREVYEHIAKKILKDTTEVWPFHPHLTLINRMNRDSAVELMKLLESIVFDKTYSLSSICLYKKEKEDKNWIEIARNRFI